MADVVREKEGCRFPDTPKDRLAEKVFNDSWSTERVASLATLTKTHRDGYNLGVRLGEPSFFNDLYLHCIDLDIRDPDKADEAWGALLELIPEARSLPSVISGSMGESRHLYFLTDRPFPSKKLRHSTEKIIGKDKKAHWAWEIERFGTGKQVVVPPSIHPDTGKRYKWEREWPVDRRRTRSIVILRALPRPLARKHLCRRRQRLSMGDPLVRPHGSAPLGKARYRAGAEGSQGRGQRHDRRLRRRSFPPSSHQNFEPRTSGRPLQRASGKDPAAACRRRLLGRRQKGRRATEAPDHVRTGDDREQRHQRISSRVGAAHHNQFERRLDRAGDIRRAALLRAQRRRYQGARHRLLRQAARGNAPRRSRRAAAPPARPRFDRLRRAQPADDHRPARSENRLAPRHRAMAFRDPVLRPRARGFDVRGRRGLLGRRLDQGRGRRFPSQLRGLVKATPVCRRSAQRFTVRRACAPNFSSDHPHSPQGRR
ncbi:bifunctional DNA primase/polymerase [Bradyrhizobium sp. SRL28]|nr:bifunctional DNA primase/polymerase [Bradyrhizobium sp. SRL28]